MYPWIKLLEFALTLSILLSLIPRDFPKAVFIELMPMASSRVEFNFNNTMYRRTDGIAIGRPSGPVLANIFVGYNENKLSDFSV